MTDPTQISAATSTFLERSSYFAIRAGSLIVGLVAILGGLLYAKQESLLYFPEIAGLPRRPEDNPRGYKSPAEHGFTHDDHNTNNNYYEEVYVKSKQDNVSIHGWILYYNDKNNNRQHQQQQSETTTPTILFFHGNAGNIGLRLPNAVQMVQKLKSNVFMVEYRGYGNSDSVPPTEEGLKRDAVAALEYIHQHLPKSPIFLFGRSLGGAVALYLTDYHEKQQHSKQLAGVMVENTFLSISHMVDSLLPWLSPIKRFVLRMNWDSVALVTNIKTPVLYLAGSADELVPHWHMKRLYRMTLNGVIHVVPGGRHNETWLQGGQAYWDAMRGFMQKAIQGHYDSAVQASTTTTTTTTKASTDGTNAVPLMSRSIFGMAKDAMTKGSTAETNRKKDS